MWKAAGVVKVFVSAAVNGKHSFDEASQGGRSLDERPDLGGGHQVQERVALNAEHAVEVRLAADVDAGQSTDERRCNAGE